MRIVQSFPIFETFLCYCYFKIKSCYLLLFYPLQAEKDVTRVNFKYFIGFEENVTDQTTELIGLFNNQPLHTPPLSLNFITNGILNSLPSYNNTTAPFQIQVTNHPFGYGANFEELGSYFTIGFQVLILLLLLMITYS